MSRSQLVLKQSTGWYAAGWQFGQALFGARRVVRRGVQTLRLVVFECGSHTGQLQSSVPALSSDLKKPESWTESALGELVERGVC